MRRSEAEPSRAAVEAPYSSVAETKTAAPLRLDGLRKAYGDVTAVDGVELEVEPGSICALLGPSGCGKTTTLRLIAGLERPDAGRIRIGDRVLSGDDEFVPPERRRIGMVFQDYALFPHLDVAGNVGYGLGRRPDRARVAEVLELVGLADEASRPVHELSGGQQQRVALARALAPTPELILLDEPFSNLDAGLRDRLRQEVREILARARVTALFVTHDQAEALSIAETVAVMRDGVIEQVGTPEEIYSRPAARWVAGFLGEVEVLPGEASAGRVKCELGSFSAEHGVDGAVDVLIRPESIAIGISGPEAPPAPRWSAGASSATISWSSCASAPAARSAPGGWASPPGTRATASGPGSTGRRTSCRARRVEPRPSRDLARAGPRWLSGPVAYHQTRAASACGISQRRLARPTARPADRRDAHRVWRGHRRGANAGHAWLANDAGLLVRRHARDPRRHRLRGRRSRPICRPRSRSRRRSSRSPSCARPDRDRRLIASGQTIHVGRSMGLTEVFVLDARDALVAHGTSRLSILPRIDDGLPATPGEPFVHPQQPGPDPLRAHSASRRGPAAGGLGRARRARDRAPPHRRRPAAAGAEPAHGDRAGRGRRGHRDRADAGDRVAQQPGRRLQGGTIVMLADAAMMIAVLTTAPAGTAIAALDLKANFLRPVSGDGRDLTARAVVEHTGRTLTISRSRLENADGKPVMLATGTAMYLPGRPASLGTDTELAGPTGD